MITIESRLKITAAFLALLLLAALLLPLTAEAAVTINEYGGLTASSNPCGITSGPDGALWFTERVGNKIGRINRTTHAVTEYGVSGNPCGITSGSDGALWFTEIGGNKIGRITTGGAVTEYGAGITGSAGLWGITSGPDGALWFVESQSDKIGRITTGGVVTEYSVTGGSWPFQITTGSDGALWFTEYNGNRIGRITTGGVVTEYGGLTAHSHPYGITSGPDGALWFTENNGNKIGRINPTTHAVTQYGGLTAGSGPWGITSGPDGALWFTERDGNRIGRIDPTTHAVTQYGGLTSGSLPFEITSGPDGALWFTEYDGNKIGRVSGVPVQQWTWTNTGGGLSSYSVDSLAYDSTRNLLYAGAKVGTYGHGVWKYNGTTWTDTGGGVSSYLPLSLAYDSTHNLLYAGTYQHGVWKYNGTTWTDITGGVPTFSINSLAYDSAHNILYAGMGGQEGVWKYDGTNWTNTAGGVSTYRIYALAYDSAHNLLYAGTYGYGVWKYNGAAWTPTAGGVSSYYINSLVYNATHNTLYAGTDNHGVWKYNGTTWTNTGGGVSSYDIHALACDSTHNVLYAGCHESSEDHGVWKYNGSTWTNTGGEVSSYDIGSLAYDSGHNVLYAGSAWPGRGVWKYKGSAPPSPTTPTSYMGEGTTAWGFSTYISIENPNTTEVHAAITYMTGTGNVSGGTLTLPAKSQTTVNPADKLGSQDFSTKINCTEGKTIAVDRTMSWTGPGAASPEGHSSVGVTAPAKIWYLPEGSSAWGFECWLCIQNPNGTAATCQVSYLKEGGTPVTKTKTIPANSRGSYSMAEDIGSADASIKVVSNVPVIPERSMYRNNRREGHNSIGTTAAANDYYLAEGTSAWGFTTYLLIMNPNPAASNVTVTYMTPTGAKAQPPISLPGNSRKTIRVNDVAGMAGTDFSTQVHGSNPIIAERAMYWTTSTGEACHDSVGLASAHTTFYLPDGQTSEGRETWTLVQNPNGSAVDVEVSYLKAGGGAVTLTSSIPANSRKTFNMAEKVPSGRAAIMVTSKTAGKNIMVERAMYWNTRGAGTDTIGGYGD